MGYELKQTDILDFALSGGYETRRKGDELEFRYCPYCGAVLETTGLNGRSLSIWTRAYINA